jgi:lipopolysaccharide biosynthesis regulator YciM
MTFDWTWFLFMFPVVFALGWFFSRLDIRHWRLESRHRPRAYFKGLNHLLTGQQDRAIESFIEAVQNDPDTSELHFTLGNLFRRRGEYDRAVRVHEHLLARADLSQADRERAQFALAQDFAKAGLLDRAEAALARSNTIEAKQLLLSVYERGRDWARASLVAEQLETMGAGSFVKRRAHYLCEQQRFDEAIALSPSSPRAYFEMAKQSSSEQALILLGLALDKAPKASPLLALPFFQAAKTDAQKQIVIERLAGIYRETQSLDILQVLISAGWKSEFEAYEAHLAETPSLVAASHLIDVPKMPAVQAALKRATEPLLRYRCAACGFEAKQYFWQCPGCQAWDSYPFKRVEEL